MRITAAVVREAGGPFLVEELELDEPRPDEVVVKVAAAGICHTDLVVRDQWFPVPLPVVLGHEGAGVVERVGSAVTRVRPGDHVVMSMLSCRTCAYLPHGTPGLLRLPLRHQLRRQPTRRQRHPARDGRRRGRARPLLQPVDLRQPRVGQRAQRGEGPRRSAARAARPARLRDPDRRRRRHQSFQARPGTSIAVFGTGAVGLSRSWPRRVRRRRIIAVDMCPSGSSWRRELGATDVIDARHDDTWRAVKEITGRGVGFSFDTTAVPAVARQALECLALTGHVPASCAPPTGDRADGRFPERRCSAASARDHRRRRHRRRRSSRS